MREKVDAILTNISNATSPSVGAVHDLVEAVREIEREEIAKIPNRIERALRMLPHLGLQKQILMTEELVAMVRQVDSQPTPLPVPETIFRNRHFSYYPVHG